MIREINPYWDGDSGPIIRFEAAGVDASAFDTSTMALACQIGTEADGLIATVPGILVSAKAGGKIDMMLPARPFDADGVGTRFILKPIVYLAVAPGGGPATNWLTNPSFDDYTGGTGVADGWTQGATLDTMVYEVRDNDPAPSTIFGKCQRSMCPVGSASTAYLTQSLTMNTVAGDWVSGGVWYRAYLLSGAVVQGTEHYIQIFGGNPDETQTTLPTTDTDWTFLRVAKQTTENHASGGFHLVNFDLENYEIRYDDAFCFKGKWRVVNVPPIRHRSRPRVPLYKGATNAVGNNWFPHGVFVDSNATSLPDGWANLAPSVTHSLSYDPDDIVVASPALPSAWKIVLTGATGQKVRFIKRGKFTAGKTYTLSVYYKMSAGATGSPAAGAFGPSLSSLPFDGAVEATSTTGANFSTSNTSYAVKNRILTLAADHNALMGEINLDSVTGTLWLGLVVLTEA